MIVAMHLILLHLLLVRKVSQTRHYLSNMFAVKPKYLLVLILVGKTFENIKNYPKKMNSNQTLPNANKKGKSKNGLFFPLDSIVSQFL